MKKKKTIFLQDNREILPFRQGFMLSNVIDYQAIPMYRIKQDNRIARSVEKITGGLMQILQGKSIAQVSVAEIALAAGVSRATFYRLFDTPMDVLVYICDRLAESLSRIQRESGLASREEISLRVLEFLIGHYNEIHAIFRSRRPDILQHAIEPYTLPLAPNADERFSEREEDYLRYTIAAVLVGILYVWDKHGRNENAAELYAMYRKFSDFLDWSRADGTDVSAQH